MGSAMVKLQPDKPAKRGRKSGNGPRPSDGAHRSELVHCRQLSAEQLKALEGVGGYTMATVDARVQVVLVKAHVDFERNLRAILHNAPNNQQWEHTIKSIRQLTGRMLDQIGADILTML